MKPTPTPTPTVVPPIPHKTVVFCNDESGSYSPANFTAAAHRVASWLDQLVGPNQLGVSTYVQWITTNSYADTATYESFDIPAIGPAPDAPGPVPTKDPLHEHEQETVVAGATKTAIAYATAGPAYQHTLQKARDSLKGQTDTLRAMPDRRAGSSDIWGCPQRATERFAEHEGDTNYLVIASDMEIHGPQEKASVDLHGAHVIVIFFQTDTVGSYNSRTQYWAKSLADVKASNVTFYRPGDSLPAQLFV